MFFIQVDKLIDWIRGDGDVSGGLIRPDIESTYFGEMRTAERDPQLHAESHHGPDELRDNVRTLDNQRNTGNARAIREEGEIVLEAADSVGNLQAGDEIKIETNQNGEYAASQYAQAALYYWREGPPTDNLVSRWGYFNLDNGFFVREDATGAEPAIRKAGTTRTITQIENNHPDAIIRGPVSLDDLDLTTGYVFPWDFAWYGGGPLAMHVARPSEYDPTKPLKNDQLVFAYLPWHDDGIPGGTRQFMETPDLPVRVEIDNDPADSTPPSQNFRAHIGGRQFSTFGTSRPRRRERSQLFEFTDIPTNRTPILSFKPLLQAFGRENDVNSRILDIEIASASGELIVDTTIGGEVTDSSSSAFSDSDYNLGVTSTLEIAADDDDATYNQLTVNTAGQTHEHLYVNSSSQGPNKGGSPNRDPLKIRQPLGIGQVYTVFARAVGSVADLVVLVRWTEAF